MTDETTTLSPRHERFVAEFLKDGNATQAYVCAGYSPRGAQPSASRLLRDPRIEAAIAAGRTRMTQALEVSVERLAQEYAKIAFANISDFVSVDETGRLQIDLTKAGEAQRAGIVELRIANHRNGNQQVTLKLGKLQALAALTKQLGVLVAKPAPGLTAEDRERYEERFAAYERSLNHRDREQKRVEEELREARAALDAAKAPGMENPNPSRRLDAAEAANPAEQPPEKPIAEPQLAVEPGMPTEPPPDHTPGLYPDAKYKWSGGRDLGLGPDSADALKAMKSGGFP